MPGSRGESHPGPHRSRRKPLALSGSCRPAHGAAPGPVGQQGRARGGVPAPTRLGVGEGPQQFVFSSDPAQQVGIDGREEAIQRRPAFPLAGHRWCSSASAWPHSRRQPPDATHRPRDWAAPPAWSRTRHRDRRLRHRDSEFVGNNTQRVDQCQVAVQIVPGEARGRSPNTRNRRRSGRRLPLTRSLPPGLDHPSGDLGQARVAVL